MQAFFPHSGAREAAVRFSPLKTAGVFAVFIISALLWYLMNVNFQLRHSQAAFVMDKWIYVSFFMNVLFSAGLLLFRKTRPMAVIPLIFSVFPLAFGIMAVCFRGGEALKRIIPANAQAGGLDWKFVYDSIWISVELGLCVLCSIVSKPGNPFPRRKNPFLHRRSSGPPAAGFVVFWECLFIVVVLGLMVIVLVQNKFPFSRFLFLLRYQIPFAILMGFKEEFFFRWTLERIGSRLTGSRIFSALIIAAVWGGYHGLFAGESVGAGFNGFFFCALVSFWWSLLCCRNDSLYRAGAAHIVIEFYGFYLMYIKYLI